MSKYSKSIAALIGMLAYLSKDFMGIEIGSDLVDKISDGIIAALTVFSVYQVRNTPL